MRRLSVWILLAGLGAFAAASASAQSLAELAKKEKKRRSDNGAESTRTITDVELSRAGGPITSTTATTAGADATEDEGDEASSTEAEGDDADAAEDPRRTREYWQGRIRAVDQRIQALEARLQSPELTTDIRGGAQRERAESDLAAAQAERRAIVEEARREGVPPGWVR